ncbi:Ig-like domain-containing protein, partial [bacterium]|nr:Ig-like domain-containing protein [bacterium]
MKKYLPLLAFLVLNLTAKADVPLDTIRVMTYNILDFPDAIGTQRVPSFRTILDQIQPDVLVVQEMKSSAGVTEFLNDVLNYSTPNLYSAVTFIDASYDSENSCFYKSSRVTFVSQDTILTNLRAFSEYVFTSNTAQTQTLRIYSAHLKSSDGTANEQQRLAEVTILRDRLSLLPTGTEFLLVGDFNLYYGSEPAFLKLTQSETNNTGRMRDPINQVGNWSNNSSYQSIHTQSTRTVSQGSGGALGGLDDRFDFILTSYGMNDTQKIDYLSSTYTSFGNDGNHFNLQINSGTNSVVSQATADALVFASDHLPVFMDFIVYGIGDSLKPTISSANATSQNTVTLTFSEDVNQTTALANSNYSLNNGIGNPTLVTLLASNSVLLTFGQNLTTTTYTLTVNNVQDLAGNTILANSTVIFFYTAPVTPAANSVIINEYTVNDAGTTTYSTIGKTVFGDWIELLVVQNGVDLRNWRLTDNNTKTLLNEGSIIFPDNAIFANIPAETLILLLTTNNAANSANFPTDDTDFSDGKMLFYVGNGNLNTSLDNGFDVSNNNDSITLLDGNGTNSATSDFADDFGIDFVAEGSTTTPTSFGIGAEVNFTGFFSGIDSNEGVYFTNDASLGFNNDSVSVGWVVNGLNKTPLAVNEGQLLSTSNSKPTLLFASVTSATNIDIFFSENLDQTTAQNTSNYSI